MGCPFEDGDGAELIVAYVARTLAPEKEAEFERHLTLCAKCLEVAAAQRTVWSALDDVPGLEVSPGFDQKLYQRIALEEQRAWWQPILPSNWSWRPAVPVAVACAALIAAFLLKSPAWHPAPKLQNEPNPKIEQVEHALDDMEMLRQLAVESAADKGT